MYVCMYSSCMCVNAAKDERVRSPRLTSVLVCLYRSLLLSTPWLSLSHTLSIPLSAFLPLSFIPFFGHFWHFKCVWLFPFDQRIVNWFTDWVQVQLMRQQQRSTELQQWKGHVALTKDLQADRHSSNCLVDLQQRNATNLSFPDNKRIQM